MDPITGAVVAAILFFVLAWVVGWIAVATGQIGAAAGIEADRPVVAIISVCLGLLVGFSVWVFFIVQAVLQVIHLIGLL